MVSVAALISDHVKAGHAVQKLRERGVPPDAIRTISRDPAAARAVATRSQGAVLGSSATRTSPMFAKMNAWFDACARRA